MLTEEEMRELLAKNPNNRKLSKRVRRMKMLRIINICVLILSVLFVLLCIQLVVDGTSVGAELVISVVAVGISAIGVLLMVFQMSAFNRWSKKEYER